MYACICHAVTVADVKAHVAAGAQTVEDLGRACGAGTGCGSCRKRLGAIIMGQRSVERAEPVEVLRAG